MSESARRKFPRCPYQQPICVTFQGKSVIVRGEEIGEGGMSFVTDIEIPVGAQVVINFFISNGQFYCLRGSVRNLSDPQAGQNSTTVNGVKKNKTAKMYRFGVNFNEINITLKRQIRSFVARSSHSMKNPKGVSLN